MVGSASKCKGYNGDRVQITFQLLWGSAAVAGGRSCCHLRCEAGQGWGSRLLLGGSSPLSSPVIQSLNGDVGSWHLTPEGHNPEDQEQGKLGNKGLS